MIVGRGLGCRRGDYIYWGVISFVFYFCIFFDFLRLGSVFLLVFLEYFAFFFFGFLLFCFGVGVSFLFIYSYFRFFLSFSWVCFWVCEVGIEEFVFG